MIRMRSLLNRLIMCSSPSYLFLFLFTHRAFSSSLSNTFPFDLFLSLFLIFLHRTTLIHPPTLIPQTVIYSQRSKLYVYGETLLNKGTGVNTWNERGIGEAKLLQHNTTQQIRLLMRQEKTMKCIANHVADHRIELARNAGSDRAWMWRAFDFSDGEELVETLFSLKFRDSELADAFQDAFQKAMVKNGELFAANEGEEAAAAAGDDAADEAAEALAALSTNDPPTEPAASTSEE